MAICLCCEEQKPILTTGTNYCINPDGGEVGVCEDCINLMNIGKRVIVEYTKSTQDSALLYYQREKIDLLNHIIKGK